MDIQEIINYYTSQLPDSMKSKPWSFTNHGKDVLQTEEQLNAYIAAYGEMHTIKCRAALQNFPFDGLTNYEIVDWGCGQGIATLTLYEMLQEHSKVYGLRRITLVEPSQVALNRAESFVRRFTNSQVEICIINKNIPSIAESNELSEVVVKAPIVIHLFSNILDINTISLRWLAKKIASYAKTQHIVSVGPLMKNYSRLSDFSNFFPEKTIFSRIAQYPYAYTETNHPFGCETMCFSLSSNNINENYNESTVESSYIDDYSYMAESLRGIVDGNIINIYNAIRAKLTEEDNIFIQPHVSTDVPDIVVVRPQKGVLILNVCNNISELDIQCNRINIYYNNFFNLHLRDIFGKTLITERYWGVVRKAIFLINEEDINKIERIINDNEEDKYKYINFITYKDINSEEQEHLLKKLDIYYKNTYCNNKLCDDVIKLITRDGWHSYKDGDENIKPTERQQELSVSKSGGQKIKGVAGSGKTQVLAWRAVNAQVRTGGRVLILTFNLTLVNYIRHRMNQVAADFNWAQFDITNYHQFFKSQANNYNIKPKIGDWDNSKFFDNVSGKTIKYDAIFFDETQDYKYEWYLLVKNNFLKEGGEFVVFGDGRQNIYGRQQDEEHEPRVPGILGRWTNINEKTNNTFRIENPEIIRLSSLFQETFFDYSEPLAQQTEMLFEQFYTKYWNVGKDVSAETLCKNIMWIINEHGLNKRDVSVLSQTCDILREIENIYIKHGGKQPITTFETEEDFVYVKINNLPKENIKKIRRIKKLHFTIDSEEIKLATIHSFKGWESSSVILILQSEESINDMYDNIKSSPELIYTGITRAKRNLFILNMGNLKYHDFFSKNITI